MKRIRVFRNVAICGIVAIAALMILLLWRPQPARAIVYATTSDDGESSIAILNPQASACAQPTLLDAGPNELERVWWSPRRDEILYLVGGESEREPASIRARQPDGSPRGQVIASIPPGYDSRSSRLSVDQRYAALLRKQDPRDAHQWDTFVLDPAIPTPREVMTGTQFFEWSPTENVLAVLRWVDGALYIVRPDGTILAKHADVIPMNPSIAWSPDGRQIAFPDANSDPQGAWLNMQIYSIDIRTGIRKQLTKTTTQYSSRSMSLLTWSPDGKYIAFVSDFARPDKTGEVAALFVLDVETGREAHLADQVWWAGPIWSPDGKRIAFVSTKDGPKDQQNYGQIYTVEVASGKIAQLTCYEGPKESLSW